MRKIIGTAAVVALLMGAGLEAGPLTQQQRELLSRSRTVGPEVVQALEAWPSVRVLIAFQRPEPSPDLPAEKKSVARSEAVLAIADEILARLPPRDFTLRRRFAAVSALAGDITSDGLLGLIADPRVVRVDLDQGGTGHLNEARPLAHIDAVRALGYSGEGVTVAVLDSGLDTDHADLQDDLVAQQCFCSGGGGCCPNGSATQSGAGAAEDDNGHGTNVAGILTSKGTIAPVGGSPDSAIVAIKVLDSSNSFCCSSDVVAGLDWILANRPDVDVVNMSLGTAALFAGDCDAATSFTMAFADAIDALRASGVLVFASSGNQASPSQMAAPACVANTLAVGAVYDSNLGPVTFGCTDSTTQADKPTCFTNSDSKTDLYAPGAYMTSTGLGGGTSTYLGTSQASPLAAACASDLRQSYPGTPPSDLEAALKTSPTSVTDPKNGLSFPRLDCEAALNALADDFFTVTPCRVLDTRNANGPYGGPILSSGIQRTFPLYDVCGIPATARSVVVNVTVVSPTNMGYLKLFPADIAVPTASTINFTGMDVRANNAILALSISGGLAVLPFVTGSGQVHLVVDVFGYFQ